MLSLVKFRLEVASLREVTEVSVHGKVIGTWTPAPITPQKSAAPLPTHPPKTPQQQRDEVLRKMNKS
jgi:hypothetical protein